MKNETRAKHERPSDPPNGCFCYGWRAIGDPDRHAKVDASSGRGNVRGTDSQAPRALEGAFGLEPFNVLIRPDVEYTDESVLRRSRVC